MPTALSFDTPSRFELVLSHRRRRCARCGHEVRTLEATRLHSGATHKRGAWPCPMAGCGGRMWLVGRPRWSTKSGWR